MSVTLLFVALSVALCTHTQGADGRTIEVDWTPEGVRPYRNYR